MIGFSDCSLHFGLRAITVEWNTLFCKVLTRYIWESSKSVAVNWYLLSLCFRKKQVEDCATKVEFYRPTPVVVLVFFRLQQYLLSAGFWAAGTWCQTDKCGVEWNSDSLIATKTFIFFESNPSQQGFQTRIECFHKIEWFLVSLYS